MNMAIDVSEWMKFKCVSNRVMRGLYSLANIFQM